MDYGLKFNAEPEATANILGSAILCASLIRPGGHLLPEGRRDKFTRLFMTIRESRSA
jgi:hypothetical protein